MLPESGGQEEVDKIGEGLKSFKKKKKKKKNTCWKREPGLRTYIYKLKTHSKLLI